VARHSLLERQIRKLLDAKLAASPELAEFLDAVNSSYQHFEDNRILVERAMRLGSEELSEKNRQLELESQRQSLLIESLRRAISEVAPHYDLGGSTDILRIADLLNEAIAERKRIEEQLREAREIAEKSLKARQIFLANVSHEIRTPIHAISGMATILQETALGEAQKNYVEAIRISAEGLTVIINDLLDISKMESGKFRLEYIAFQLPELIAGVTQSLVLRAEEKGILLSAVSSPDLPEWLEGDPTRLRQILLNLLTNAIKFTTEGSATLKVSLVSSGGSRAVIRFEVSDTGVGIEQHKLAEIFEQFVQEDDSVARRFGGTGLGLSISKTLVEMMGGTLNAESRKAIGSRFCFEVEFALSTDPGPAKQGPDTFDYSGMRMLVVDDNEINRFLATTILTRWNAEVHEAEDGIQALEKVAANHYDLVLLDIQMPRMDGIQVIRKIRAEFSKTLPVIALSANATIAEKSACLEEGMTDYLTKPFNPRELAEVISRHTDGRRTELATPDSRVLYSLNRINTLFAGNKSHVMKTTAAFATQLEHEIDVLQNGWNMQSTDEIERSCHRMSANLELFEMNGLARDLSKIQQFAQERAFNELRTRIPVFIVHCRMLVTQLKSECGL
jgi:signal transduction histidine kinase/CheY-like chemotaxis protein